MLTTTGRESTKRDEVKTSDSVRDGLGVQFGLLFLLKDSFVKFVVVVLLIHFSVRIRLIENSMELQAISESSEERIDGAYVGYKGLHQPVGMLHIRHNHKEIVVRCSQQVWTEYDSQGVRCHLVVFLVVGDPRSPFHLEGRINR